MLYALAQWLKRTSGDDWTDCFTVNAADLPVAPYIGFSALTGDVSDNHEYVPTWYTCELLP